MICKHAYYSGRVQGVGFRWTAQHLARGFAVVGFVRNLPNRDVELVAQGETDAVEQYLAAVASRMVDCIDRTTTQDEPPGDYQGFAIRY